MRYSENQNREKEKDMVIRYRPAHTTAKELRERNDAIVHTNIGDDEWSIIATFIPTPTATNSGAYGWNFDAFELFAVDVESDSPVSTAICSGYRNLPMATHKLTEESVESLKACKRTLEEYGYSKARNQFDQIVISIEKIMRW